MTIFQSLIANLLTLVSLSVIFPTHIMLNSITTAIFSAVVLTFLNLIIRPIIQILLLPITILTVGLFSFVINALMLELTSYFVKGLDFSSFWVAILTALVLGIINSIIIKENARETV